jgi:alpha-methylacyl-CoA racemase
VDRALLAGITVLDLSRLLPGPLATWHLAALGAKVLKIEPPDGDYVRGIGPMDGDTSFLYRHLNEGKEIASLDLSRIEGQTAFREWLRRADLVLESFRPGVLARMGFGFDRLREINPRISLVSISGFGAEGPLAQKAGHDLNYLALSGWLQELLPPEGEPALPNLQIGDVVGGAMTAAFASVSALFHAARTGSGIHVDVSVTAALTSINILPLAYARAGMRPPALGHDLLNGGLPCYGLYRTQDGRYLAVAALESKFWARLCDALGRPDLVNRHWQSGQQIGGEDARALREELTRLFAEKPLAHWSGLFADLDCCVTPVLRIDEVLRDSLPKVPSGIRVLA